MSDLLPNNSTKLEHALAESGAAISDIPVDIKDIWNPNKCPANLLPWLAWALSVDEWDPAWSEERRRATIRSSVSVHKYKGTIGAVREALKALISNARVQEWFNQLPEGNPYTFRVLLDVAQDGVSQPAMNSIAAVIERTKNLRSHLDRIDTTIVSSAGVYAGVISSLGSEVSLPNYIYPPSVISQTTLVV